MLQAVLKEFLVKIEREERRLPIEKRRRAPTMSDISRESGISFQVINRLANGHAKHLNLSTGNKIIKAVRRRGFAMGIQDLFRFIPDEEKPIQVG